MTCREEGCRYPAFRGGRCYAHAEIHADSTRSVVNDRKHRGLCISCAHPWTGPTKTCRTCLDRVNRRHTLIYWQLRQLCLCVICAEQPAPQYAACDPCRSDKARRRSPKARARKSKRDVQRTRELRAAKPPGQCSKPRCSNDAPGRFKMCPACRAARLARDHDKRGEGLCPCGQQPKPGCSRCQDCLNIHRRSERQAPPQAPNSCQAPSRPQTRRGQVPHHQLPQCSRPQPQGLSGVPQ